MISLVQERIRRRTGGCWGWNSANEIGEFLPQRHGGTERKIGRGRRRAQRGKEERNALVRDWRDSREWKLTFFEHPHRMPSE